MDAPTSRTILHVTAPARFGGLESVVAALAGGHVARGHRVTVAAVVEPGAGEGHPFLRTLSDAGVEPVALEIPGRAYRRERGELRALIERVAPDVVHTHGFRTDVVDAPVARAAGVPTVTTVHGFTGGGWKARLYESLQMRSFRRFDAVVAVSRPLSDELLRRGMPPERLHLLPNAWRPAGPRLSADEARERLSLGAPRAAAGGRGLEGEPGRKGQGASGIRTGAPVRLGWVGRMSREKAPDIFVEALGQLRGRAWTASMVGDGPLREELERRCSELGVADRVHWHGNVPGAGALMGAFDAFVLSSRTEGTPIVLLEAMAGGLPIVATAVGGVADLVGDAAALVEPGSPAALAEVLARMLDDPELRAGLGRAAARRLDERGDEEAWLTGYERVYDAARAASRTQ